MASFAVHAKDGDELDWPIDRAEPVGGEGAEFDRFAWLHDEVLLAKDESHPSVQHVHPVVTVMDSQLVSGWWAAAFAGDTDLEGAQPTRCTVGEWPHRQAVASDWFATGLGDRRLACHRATRRY